MTTTSVIHPPDLDALAGGADRLDANQRGLASALAGLRAALETHVGGPAAHAADPPAGTEPAAALESLCHTFGLSEFERAIVLLCAGVELDSGFAAACAAAQGDPARRFATFGLALAALPEPHWSALAPAAPLRRWRLVEAAPGELTAAPLRLDERVLHYLVGVEHLDERLAGLVEATPPADEPTPSQRIVADQIVTAWRRVDGPLPVAQLCGADPAAQLTVAAGAAASLGLSLLTVDAARLPSDPRELETVARLCERESALAGAALLVEADADLDVPAASLGQFLATTAAPLLLGTREPRRIRHRATVVVEARRPTVAEQRATWRRELESDDPFSADRLAGQFDLGPAAIRAVCRQAAGAGSRPESTFGIEALWDACRIRVRPALDGVALRIEPDAGWDDLVLPLACRQILEQVAAHVAHRLTVYEDWQLGRVGGARGLGTSVLFAGPSGTGKTLAADVLAHELRLDLYRIDLSQVVSKYIGETEKNLRRVFDAAEEGGAVLLFDEADALFGKRSEVRDSHDRYANIEVSYLLQRMETYRGLAILTTNLRDALDPAFLRRIRFAVTFPFPDAALRAEIWRRAFPAATPLGPLDVDALARLNVTGGNIRNISVNAAFLAAAAGEPVGMAHLARAARTEYAKLDKPLTAVEMRGWA
jgi:hypothetical protein